MFENRDIYRAIGELAYVIAKATNGLQPEEKAAFMQIIKEELKFEAWAAESRFEILDEKIHPTIDHAYNEAIHELKLHQEHLTPELKAKTLAVLRKVAQACGNTEIDEFILDRLESDLKKF
ncbi:hypothetical protein [Fulvivirga sediminis]|uniref:Co-chaperone DjlA N-terminal domain-containing protein n=1 Tax=Fulvivirga sediminis TaxID=2803949 RepID=A0A937F750_9BACT|nr:hypothetical protein [Fulvivirga sediminis]MBL3655318.1 hypothetical protein [Fulvivirga sediminis]